mgnify:CR=1 FL=1
MEKPNLEKVYFYAASLVLLIAFVILVITLISNLVNYLIPSTRIYAQDEYALREQIVRSKYGPELSSEELQEKIWSVTDNEIKDFLQKQANQERAQLLKSILSQALSLAFVLPLYLFHYRMARKLS